MVKIKRGDIFLADLEPVRGSEQGGVRPVLVLQNDISNKFSPVTIVAAITSKIFSKDYPTNVFLSKRDSKLSKDSTILLNQIRTIDVKRLKKKVSKLDGFFIDKVNNALRVSLSI